MLDEAAEEPVFLHSLWRTGSTYLFGKFRETQRYYCLYEPLHEFMGRLNESHMREFSGRKIAAKLSHSTMSGGYFDEYRPFQRRGIPGVPGYRESMTVADFFAGEKASFQQYIAGLVAGCRDQGLRPLLQFCRSTGRLEFFRNRISGTNVYLQRNPRDQWQSYLAGDQPYFMPLTLAYTTLCQLYAERISTVLEHRLPGARSIFGLFHRRSFRRTLQAARRFECKLSDADRYRVFYADWLRARREAQRHCDLVVDINRISHDANARKEIEDAFSIRLDDCRIKEYQEHRLSARCMDEIEREVSTLVG